MLFIQSQIGEEKTQEVVKSEIISQSNAIATSKNFQTGLLERVVAVDGFIQFRLTSLSLASSSLSCLLDLGMGYILAIIPLWCNILLLNIQLDNLFYCQGLQKSLHQL